MSGYANLADHIGFAYDETRNRAYLAAIRQVVTPESVVLDLGAGVGVLGLLAAKAGARRVYCVDPSPVIAHVPALAAANGVRDRVVALRGRIDELDPPEPVDVILSVMTGNLLFNEGLLPSLFHARDRWLKPGGALIPDRARLLLAGVEAADAYMQAVGRCRQPMLGLDFSPLAKAASNLSVKTERGASAPQVVTSTAVATELDLHDATDDVFRWRGALTANRDATLHGLLGWIELRLGDAWLSTAVDAPDVHWSPILLPLAEPIHVARGQTIAAAFRYIEDAQIFWTVTLEGTAHHQCTVLGDPDLGINLALSAPDCDRPPTAEALLVGQVLAGIRAGKPNRLIVAELMASMPQQFPHERDAVRRVGALAAQYRQHPARKGRIASRQDPRDAWGK